MTAPASVWLGGLLGGMVSAGLFVGLWPGAASVLGVEVCLAGGVLVGAAVGWAFS